MLPMDKGAPANGWVFPIDLDKYDKSYHLLEEEYRHSEILVLRFQQGGKGWHKQAYITLQRLLAPLYDVLDYLGADNSLKRNRTIRTTVIILLIRAMYQYRISYWGFSNEIWHEMLGNDYYAYVRKHGVTANARQQLIAVAYILCNFNDIFKLGRLSWHVLSNKIFGSNIVNSNIAIIMDKLKSWGYTNSGNVTSVRCALTEVFLVQRSPVLADIKFDGLKRCYAITNAKVTKRGLVLISCALVSLGIINQTLSDDKNNLAQQKICHRRTIENVPSEWLEVCDRWYQTSALQYLSKIAMLYKILQVGRWFKIAHPELNAPTDWTRDICIEFIAAVDKMTVGQWASPVKIKCKGYGTPISAKYKEKQLSIMRVFFTDLQDWGWVNRKFNPSRALATPRSIKALLGPNPRIIDDGIWAKLIWASLNLTNEELTKTNKDRAISRWRTYPPAMIRALSIVWLFTGLRRNEILRLRLGCIRFQENGDNLTQSTTCLLDVPVNKTSTAFTKPVDIVVGQAIKAWENCRPPQPDWFDSKTNEKVQLLFSIRGKRVGMTYLNKVLIPLLCQKANVPISDVRGNITSHRARATIASQLYNAKEPLSLFELQDWLGHASPETTRHYTKISPTTMAKSYANAEYFARNLRAINVLIDRDALKEAQTGLAPWKLYDLGHGYCSYDFFEQCPHRMACAKCDFYIPKGSTKAELIEGKHNLLRLRQNIPLTEIELAAVDGDLAAYQKLLNQLENEEVPSNIKTI